MENETKQEWWHNAHLIGELIRVDGEKDLGVVTRIDEDQGLIYVMFKRLREKAFPYPEALENRTLTEVKKS